MSDKLWQAYHAWSKMANELAHIINAKHRVIFSHAQMRHKLIKTL